MSSPILTSVTALMVCALTCWRLGRAPEPTPGDDGFVKPRYRDIAGRRFVAVALVCAFLLSLIVPHLPWPLRLAWAVTAGGGSVLALCDQLTTYLPSSVLRPLAGVVWLLVAADVINDVDTRHAVIRTVVGLILCTTLFWALWRMGAGLGFGDVRLVAMLSALTAATSSRTCTAGLVAGTMLGAVAGLVTAVWRRRRPSALGSAFAYGPALFLGAWIALALPR